MGSDHANVLEWNLPDSPTGDSGSQGAIGFAADVNGATGYARQNIGRIFYF
jgi:hypothetical protein